MGQCHASALADRAPCSGSAAPTRANSCKGWSPTISTRRKAGAPSMPGCSPRRARSCSISSWSLTSDGFLLDVAQGQGRGAAKRLGFYRLRAAGRDREEPALAVGGGVGRRPLACPKAPSSMPIRGCPSSASACSLPAGTSVAELGCEPASEADYHALRIGLGVPEGGRDYAFGDAFPHEALFDQLNGVDFNKGCYVGQEVVSRMEHRGTARKRIVPVEGEAPLPAPGTSIEAGGVPIGTLGSVERRVGAGADPARPRRGSSGARQGADGGRGQDRAPPARPSRASRCPLPGLSA